MNFNEKIFASPSSEYRDAPFWSWNGKIEAGELEKQLVCFKEMGFGGVHIHPRTGMDTKYLSDEYMELVEVCIKKAAELGMYIYLYDEDRWPSGFAGGFVTENPSYRARHLLFTKTPYEENPKSAADAPFSITMHRTGNGRLIAVYDIVLDRDGNLKSYRQIDKEDEVYGEKWYAYLELAETSPWFNGFTNADLLNPKATEEFLRVTHEKYYERFGKYFGNLIPSVFTDEPQISFNRMLKSPFGESDVILSWTDDLPKTFNDACGLNLIAGIPELIWEGKAQSEIRYHYYRHLSERFMSGFLYPYSKWCKEHNIKFSGHFLEGTPCEQTNSVGDTMLMYDSQDIPGIDILADSTEPRYHAKLMQSVARQNGKKRMMCEIYGVNNWNFEFRDYLFEGNWAAACGINLRAHHLSMYTMEGEGKRDYPGSIGYQAPWCERYRTIEDYFARINYILSLGESVVRVGVINPVESSWLAVGNNKQTKSLQKQLDDNFRQITNILSLGGIDFDFISEALLPGQYRCDGLKTYVGKMHYDAVIVPPCSAIRKSTAEILGKMSEYGVKLIFAGMTPKYCGGKEYDFSQLLKNAQTIPFSECDLLSSVEPHRILEIRDESGCITKDILHQIRKDGDTLYLFAASIVKPAGGRANARKITFTLKGSYEVEKANLFDGVFEKLYCETTDGYTVATVDFYDFGSVLLRFSERAASDYPKTIEYENKKVAYEVDSVRFSEPNALVLDIGTYRIGDGAVMPAEELLRADNKMRETLGLEQRCDVITQPWKMDKRYLGMSFTFSAEFYSEIDYSGALLALENYEDTKIIFNGSSVPLVPVGYYADRRIFTIALPAVKKGKNTLEAVVAYSTKTNVENFIILGNFGVKVNGSEKTLTSIPEKIAFGELGIQGFPFYGGNVTYDLSLNSVSPLYVSVPHYIGALVTVSEDGKIFDITQAPYTAELPQSEKDIRKISVTLYGTRYNTFGPLHNCRNNDGLNKSHPNSWRTKGNDFSYEYQFKPFGIMKAPEVFE